ncbi:DUF305 domain-containing protein [Mycobacterium sp. 852014-52144_SCH5372336]|uniref:DUF305 domain-containing protein n=1 Tax=Mycobacterium sp. 852014-52144_SCH5372336 TaxID=1834115 RepID=UPI0008013916|nr:DUF305 domain-containing protein [Mycobacterium sp. 852014-52144_SCH5372336]OBB77766.1 DUF305 domain-containing protein [Mycobacterium sp. 852014-52144_SCH5372336]
MQHKRIITVGAAAIAVTVTLSACSNSDNSGDTAATTPVTTPTSTSVNGAGQASHNQADVTFAQGMIPHHQQAIEMSDMVLAKDGIDPQVVELANEIKAAQGPEIEQLQTWLREWGVAATPPTGPMPNMPGHDMDGMMSEQDMAALRDAQGVEASRLFLTQMIEHHEGAISMARTEVDSGQFPAAVDMARSIISSQQQEIDSMQQLLQQL